MSEDNRRKQGLEYRKLANEALQKKQSAKAVEYFTLALQDPTAPQRQDHVVALHCGRAGAYNAMFGYDWAVLDACAALQYKEDYSRALEKRAVARKALGEFALAVEDFTNAAECSTEQNYRRRMLAEAEKAGQAEAVRRKLIGTNETLERDFGQAHLEFLSRGNDLSKNPIVQTIVMVFNEIEEGWKRFFETCDPESDNPDIEGLLMILEVAHIDPRAMHFTSRGIERDRLLEKLDRLLERHARPFDTENMRFYATSIPTLGLEGPRGIKELVERVLDGHGSLSKANMLSERLKIAVPLIGYVVYCAYRTLLVGDRLPSRLTRYISELTTGLLKSKLKSDIWRQSETSKSPPLTLGKEGCIARAYVIEAFFARSKAQLPDKTDHINTHKTVFWPNLKLMRDAARLARSATELLSDHDEEKAFAETLALCCELESDSRSLRGVLSSVAHIACIRDYTQKFFGPSPRREVCQATLRSILQPLATIFLGKQRSLYHRMSSQPKVLEEFLDLVLRPVGTMVLADEYDGLADAHMEKATLRYMDQLMGDLSLWNFETLAEFEARTVSR